MSYRILLVGGGTGGHVYPLVAVAEQARQVAQQKNITLELEFMGDGDVLRTSATELSLPCVAILSPKWRRYFSVLNFTDLFKFPIGLVQSLYSMWRFMPDCVFAKGGYSSFLPLLAAKLYNIPIYLHDSDAIPGKTVVMLSKLARKIFLASPAAQQYFPPAKTEVVGNPLRSGLLQSGFDRADALKSFQLDPSLPSILITGGSQGAQTINNVLLLALAQIVEKYQIIHQCGTANYKDISQKVKKLTAEGSDGYGSLIEQRYRAYPAFNTTQMAQAYQAADLVISRAGSQIYELAALGKPTIVIPLANAASNHQLANAQELARYGGVIIEESNLTPHILLFEIDRTYADRVQIAEKIKGFTNVDAATRIAGQLFS